MEDIATTGKGQDKIEVIQIPEDQECYRYH